MRIRWLGGSYLDLKPEWEVQGIRIHTIQNRLQPDGSKKDEMLLAILATGDQIRTLQKDYPGCIETSILGLKVMSLEPGRVFWTWSPPKDHPNAFKAESYTAFEVVPDKEEVDAASGETD